MTDLNRLRVSALAQNTPTEFSVSPDSEIRRAIAEELQLLGLRKLNFAGRLEGQGKSDWLLTAELGATVSQPCAVTLAPVTTRIDVPVRRLFQADYESPDAPELEMPEDVDIEPLGPFIDLHQTMIEALSLNLPLYPRADGASIGEANFTEPGKQAMRDEDTRPFAGLAALRSKMGDSGDNEG